MIDNTAGPGVDCKASTLATSATIVATANTALSLKTIRYLNSPSATVPQEITSNETSVKNEYREN